MATATESERKPLSPKQRSLKDKEIVSPFVTFMNSRPGGFGMGTSAKWATESGTNIRRPLTFEEGAEAPAGDAFSSFLAMRPKVRPPPTTTEQQLREEVLRTKRQLLQVALQAELEDLGSSPANEASRQARRMRRAYKYLRNPERTLEAMSDASSPRDEAAEVTAHDLDAAAKPSASPPLSHRSLLQNELQPSARSQRSQRSQGSAKDTDTATQQTLGASLSMPNLSQMQGTATSITMSLPPLSDVSRPGAKKQEGEPLLSGWWAKTRCWNMGISKRDIRARRQNLGLPGGGVVLGNGRMNGFFGSHLLVTGYFYAFQVEAVDDDHFPLKQLKDMSIGLGVSRLPGRDKACERPMYAYEVPETVLVGYGGHVIEGGRWKRTTWDPRDLKNDDVVGVLVEPGGDLVVYVNDEQVLRVPTTLNETDEGPVKSIRKRELFPIVDLHGRVSAVNILPRQGPPNKPLHARNRVF